MQSWWSKQEREGEWGREDGGQKHRGILLIWLHLPRKCSPLFSHKTLTSGQLWTAIPEEEGTCQGPPALVYHWSLSFIIGPTCQPPIHFWVMMSCPLGSCRRSHFTADDATLPLSPKVLEKSAPLWVWSSQIWASRSPRAPASMDKIAPMLELRAVEAQSVVAAFRLWQYLPGCPSHHHESLEAGGAE